MSGASQKKTPDIFAGDPATMKVGLCQILTEEWAVQANLERALAALDEAAAQSAAVAVLPECCLHGYAGGKGDDFHQRLLGAAEPADGPSLKALAAKAAAKKMHLVAGFAERDERDRLYNSAALISPEGEVLDVYRKVHCRPFESAEHQGHFVPGDRFFVQPLPAGESEVPAGLMICFDREMPEAVRCLRVLGAEIIFCPLATRTYDPDRPGESTDNEQITRVRAAENELFIVVVNHAGRQNGGSYVVGPGGEILRRLGEGPETAVVDVPVGAIQSRFRRRPLGWLGWGHRRPAVYGKYL